MPRRRANQLEELELSNLALNQQPVIIQHTAQPFFASDYLRKNHYEMKKSLKKETECSICLEKVCCEKCYTLLTCGHEFCLRCIIRCNNCPLCRTGQEN